MVRFFLPAKSKIIYSTCRRANDPKSTFKFKIPPSTIVLFNSTFLLEQSSGPFFCAFWSKKKLLHILSIPIPASSSTNSMSKTFVGSTMKKQNIRVWLLKPPIFPRGASPSSEFKASYGFLNTFDCGYLACADMLQHELFGFGDILFLDGIKDFLMFFGCRD